MIDFSALCCENGGEIATLIEELGGKPAFSCKGLGRAERAAEGTTMDHDGPTSRNLVKLEEMGVATALPGR